MSLSEALLLDPYPFEVWIAARTDGVKGSGTQADPWSGASIPYPEVSVSSLTASGSEATVVTSSNHGFANRDMVTISGVARTDPSHIFYVGTFPIYGVASNSFKYAMLGVPNSNAAGTIKCWREREQFDVIMRTIGPNTAVHLGPGVFETKGVAPNVFGGITGKFGSWHIKAGQHLHGSGMGSTVLKLVNASFAETQWWAISHYPYALADVPNYCQVSDLTIDCNISGQPNQQLDCAAIAIAASHVRIRRIRAINFGSQTLAYIENFVVVLNPTNADLGDIQAHDSVMEDCIAERTCANPTNNSTIFFLGGGLDASGIDNFNRDFAIRNCYVDGRIVYGSQTPVPVDTISYAGGVVTVTTKAPHLLTYPGNVIISGVTVGGSSDNLFNGVFAIKALDATNPDTKFTYDLNTTGTPQAGTAFVGGGVSSHGTNIKQIVKLYSDPNDKRFKVTTWEPHHRTTNNNVRISGLLRPDPADPNKYLDTHFNGSFAVDSYDPSSPNELQFTLLDTIDADIDPVTKIANLYYPSGVVNVGHQGLSAGNGIGTIVENNRVYHCSTGGPYHDSYSSGDCVTRHNFYHDVLVGPAEACAPGCNTNYIPVPCSVTHNNGTATATTSFPHGLRAGDFVYISNVYAGTPKVQINGVPSATSFTYAKPSAPLSPAPQNPGYATYEEAAILGGTVAISFQSRLASFTLVRQNSRAFGRVSVTGYMARHGLSVGDAIRLTKAGAFQGGSFPQPDLSPYNGIFRVSAIVDSETFDYQFTDVAGTPYDPGDPPSGAPFSAGHFGRIWQVKRWVVEDNIIELGLRYFSGYGNLTGIPIYTGRFFPPEYTVREAIIRNNIFRNINDASAPSHFAMDIGGCEKLLIENNVISIDSTMPIRANSSVGRVSAFNNMTPDGKLIQAINPNSNAVFPDPRTDLDDALLFSLLRTKTRL